MKKVYSTILLLATMVAALSLTACGSDNDNDDDVGNNTPSIIGKWTVIKYTIYLDLWDDFYEYKGNGEYIVISDNTITAHDVPNNSVETVKYTRTGNVLHFPEIDWEITELTSTHMVMCNKDGNQLKTIYYQRN